MIENRKSRFIDASCNEPVKCMSSLFDPAKFPSTLDDPALSDYGVPELKTLAAHYSELEGFSSLNVQQELPQFKCLVVKSLKKNAKSMSDLCQSVFQI